MKLPERISITWLKENYRNGNITPYKVMEEIIKRTEEYEKYNIWIVKPDMKFIRFYLEQLGSMNYEKKLLWGIPFAIKDNIDLEHIPTTAGCEVYSYLPDDNASVVERLVRAGAIPVGKTNMDQFATGLVGTRSPYGEVHNSYHEELISGGSSSGSAVAAALGMAAFTLGTDTAGSGRVPAALNNLVGYKSTVGAWPIKGVVPACASLDCVTVFANSVADAMAVDRIARGIDYEDRWSKDVERASDALPQVVYIPEKEPEFYGSFQKEYKRAWEKSQELIKAVNIPVKRVSLEFYNEAAKLLYDGPCVAERWSDLGDFVQEHPKEIFPVTKTILETGNRPDYSAEYLFQTMHRLMEYKNKSRKLLQNAIFIFPTCAGTYSRDEVRENPITANSNMGKYTNHCNLLDLCAIAIPAGFADEGLPFGITAFGSGSDEHLICGFAAEFEGVNGLSLR